MNLCPILKYVHILSAIVAFGANLTYVLWLTRVANKPEALSFTLRTINILDSWIANPAYVLLLPTGLWMVSLVNWPLATPWLLTALVFYAVITIVGLAIYTPNLRQQIKLAETVGPNAADYKRVARRGIAIGIVLNMLVFAVIFLMVTKPTLLAA